MRKIVLCIVCAVAGIMLTRWLASTIYSDITFNNESPATPIVSDDGWSCDKQSTFYKPEKCYENPKQACQKFLETRQEDYIKCLSSPFQTVKPMDKAEQYCQNAYLRDANGYLLRC